MVDGWDTRFLPRQDGRRFVITGATGGLGQAAARALDGVGASVVLAVRDVAKGEEVAAQLSDRAVVRRLDVADLASVRDFAAATGEVDVLVNNAGIMGVGHGRSVDGFEMQLATNHLGHFALTNLLLPRLTDRVVMISSRAHTYGRIDPEDLHFDRRRYHPFTGYAQSKLANLLHMSELQRRLTAAGSTLRAVAGHPGYSATGITSGTDSRLFTRMSLLGNRLVGMTPERGVLPVLFVATMDVPGNTYVGPHGAFGLWGSPVPERRSELAANPGLARALWERSEALTGTRFPF